MIGKRLFNILTGGSSVRQPALIVNLMPIKSGGGGLQNALSFISVLPESDAYLFMIGSNSSIRDALKQRGFLYVQSKGGWVGRLLLELKVRFVFPKNTICFTYFGPPPLGGINHFYNVSGFAYSNILHPEVDFWSGYSIGVRQVKSFVDSLRRWACFSSDELIFETQFLLERARRVPQLSNKVLHCVPVAPSVFIDNGLLPAVYKPDTYAGKKRLKILYISGPHRNKRIECIVTIINCLLNKGVRPQVVLTLPDSKYTVSLFDHFSSSGVLEYIDNIGMVPPTRIQDLYNDCDVVINLARLESFSNNFVEAWASRKPLLVADAGWSRAACKSSALYVDPCSKLSVEVAIKELFDDSTRASVIRNGMRSLSNMPSHVEKNSALLSIIDAAVERVRK